MFGWFKGRRKKDKEFLESMMRTAVEGHSRVSVNRALGSLGIQLSREPDNTQFSIRASSALVRAISEKAGLSVHSMDDDDRFVAAIFCFVTSDHISHIIGAPFEMVSTVVPLDLFGHKYADRVFAWGNSFNRMAAEGRVVEAIGENIAKWIAEPTNDQFEKLAKLFQLCRKSA
jgi:hypothetical protein